jgi:hypothetical protein
MRQIKVHSPVQDRIGGTGHQLSFNFKIFSTEDYRKREFNLFISLPILCSFFGDKAQGKN